MGTVDAIPPHPPLICFLVFLCLRTLRTDFLFLVLPKIFKNEKKDLLDFAIYIKDKEINLFRYQNFHWSY
jgi:hypothetical protein